MRYKNLNFNENTGAYLRTTENINGYYDRLYFKDKKILSVVGSGDQIFEAILRGAKEIDGFDISHNAILLYYLKEAAIKTLRYEDYLDFFFVEKKCFTREIYNVIRTQLNEIALPFWDKVFNIENKNPLEIIETMLVGKPVFYLATMAASVFLSELSSYLSEENYYTLQSKINNAKIKISLRDIKNVEQVSDFYDYIIFSNIFEYQDSEEFKELINKYREHLNENGLIVVGYAYDYIDLSYYSEFDKFDIPSRDTLKGLINAKFDHIITTGKKKENNHIKYNDNSKSGIK